MIKTRLFSLISILAIFTAGCNFNFFVQGPPASTATSTSAVDATATPASPFAWPAGSDACILVASTSQVAYDRPSLDANPFGDTGAGFETQVSIRTFDGWVGFDPGVAQAANIGIFRYRWLHFDQVSLSGNCVSVPQATWVPQPDACYDMPMEAVSVYSGADTSSSVLATLEIEDFAAVLGLTGTGWAQVDLGDGNTGLTGIGWVEDSTLNMNGTICDELPTVSP
ncbi:MAG: SH3 domain-containing protein [Anaerolineales bacterium]